MIYKIKNKVKQIFNSFEITDLFLYKAKVFLLNKISKKKLRCIKIKHLAECDDQIYLNLERADTFYSVGPKELYHAHIQNKKVCIPPLNLYLFRNVLINNRSSCIFCLKKLVVESYNNNERFNEGFVELNSRYHALIKVQEIIIIDEGFFLAGNGSWNWFHWLTELLPKLIYIDKVPIKTILVSNELQQYQSMFDSLKVFLGEKFKLIYLDYTKNYQVKKLYHINAVSYLPYNMFEGAIRKVEDVYMRKSTLMGMRDKILSHFNVNEDIKMPEKVLFFRKNHRVALNQEEFTETLKTLGFEALSFEDLGLKQQISYMQHAKIVVGITGAAFTNLMFAKPKTKAICLMQKGLEELSCFSNLSAVFDIELNYHFYETKTITTDHYTSDFYIDIKEVCELYKKMMKV